MRRVLAYPIASIGALLCILIVLGAVLAPWIAPHDPLDQNIIERLAPPSGEFPFGTDAYGLRTVYDHAVNAGYVHPTDGNMATAGSLLASYVVATS